MPAVFIFLCARMCAGHGWLCPCLLAIVHAIVHSHLTLFLCIRVCSPGLSALASLALCFSSDSVSGGIAAGWASTAGTQRPIGDNYWCFIAAKGKNKKEQKGGNTKKHSFHLCSPVTKHKGFHRISPLKRLCLTVCEYINTLTYQSITHNNNPSPYRQ